MRTKGLLILVVLLSALLCTGCKAKGEKEAERQRTASEIVIGTWQLREVNDGVTYSATFMEDGRLLQRFQNQQGGAKEYPGTWEVHEDTLYISERQGEYHMTITEISDSSLIVVRSDSIALVFDRKNVE